MLNVIGFVLLLATVALLSWASRRAWRQTNRVLKWGGAGLAALLATAVACVSVLALAGLMKLHTRRAPVPALKVAGTPDQIQRGQAIATSFCDACHSTTGPLTGGEDIGAHYPMGAIWRIYPVVSGLPRMPRGQFGGRRGGSAWAYRTQPQSGQALETGGIYRHHAHRHRSRRPCTQPTNAVASDWQNG